MKPPLLSSARFRSIRQRLVGASLFFVAFSQTGEAGQICDFEHKCFDDAPPHQTYHMNPNDPDAETPPPAPQYPAPSAQGRDIVVQPNAREGCHLFRMRSTPAIAPQIVEICPISPDEEAEIRQRVEGLGAAQ